MTDEDDEIPVVVRAVGPMRFSGWNALWVALSFAEDVATTVGSLFSDLGSLVGAHSAWLADREAFADKTRADIEAMP